MQLFFYFAFYVKPLKEERMGAITLRKCVSHGFSPSRVKETEKNAWLPLVLLSKRLWKSCKRKFR